MTINEAIKKLERTLEGDSRCCHPERYDAIKLGIEALIFYKTHKSRVIPPYDVLLPSETKE